MARKGKSTQEIMEDILRKNEEIIQMLAQLCISKGINLRCHHPYNRGTRGVHAMGMRTLTPCGKVSKIKIPVLLKRSGKDESSKIMGLRGDLTSYHGA